MSPIPLLALLSLLVQDPGGRPVGDGTGAEGGGVKPPVQQGPVQEGSGQPAPLPPPPTNKGKPIPEGCWFKVIHLDFGEVVENTQEHFEGEFPFENNTGEDQQITAIVPSCKCQGLQLFIDGKKVEIKRKPTPDQPLEEPVSVPKGAKAKIVMKLSLEGGPQLRIADIRFDTTDPAMPSFLLTCEAKITAAFKVEPDPCELGTMSTMEVKHWSFKIRNNLRADGNWKIEEQDPVVPAGIHVERVAKAKDETGPHWVVEGTYGPDLPQGASGGNIVFKTDDPLHNVMVRITAEVKQKAVLWPGFLSLGNFPRKEAQVRTFYLFPANGVQNVSVKNIEVFKSSCDKEWYEVKIVPPAKDDTSAAKVDGLPAEVTNDKLWRIEVHTKAGIPGRVFRLKANVHLNGAGFATKSFWINGFPKDS